MAIRSFLTDKESKQAKKRLVPPSRPPDGKAHLGTPYSSKEFSLWLGSKVESRFQDHPYWQKSDPIAIGSWGRGELCPGSDFDVIFCGPEKHVKKVVDDFASQGMKLRYRVPEDDKDWTKGVDVLEVNAIFWAKAFTDRSNELLEQQKAILLKNRASFRKKFLRDITVERKRRQKRYDSIANFLEPNLKFGAGGLRDLQQALMLAFWYPEKFEGITHTFDVLQYYKDLFLMTRQKLHMEGGGDILAANDQMDLAKWFGFEKNSDFMGEIQKGLARVSFHADWSFDRCKSSVKTIKSMEKIKIENWKNVFQLIKKEPGLLAQHKIRSALYRGKSFKKKNESSQSIGRQLRQCFSIKEKEELIIALYRSQMISHAIPDFTRVTGLVQHDQYHRYSVDAHLVQAIREVKRVYNHPNLLGKLAQYTQKMTLKDWEILTWTALYHDLAKGRGGDHSKKGIALVKKDLNRFGFPKDVVTEVAWLVENHLVLSIAAFRKNPRSPQTWEDLFRKGIRGQRLKRLTLFTAIDIRATNPDAWSSWKENLLFELAETLRDPSTERFYDLAKAVQRRKIQMPFQFLEQLDLGVAESIPHDVLLKDFKSLVAGGELDPLVFRDKKNQVWVRFHNSKDRKGLFLSFVQTLSSLGCNIRQAAVLTDKKYGAYDWFRVKTTRSPKILKKQLNQKLVIPAFKTCHFSNIQLVEENELEWVFSFRAKDRKGLLANATQALYDNDLEIVWAKVHTWGRQIDDVFGVKPLPKQEPQDVLRRLKEQLVKEQLEVL